MRGLSRMEMAGNLFEVLGDSGAAICTLGSILQAVDEERLEDSVVNNLGGLLAVIGGSIIQTAYYGKQHTEG